MTCTNYLIRLAGEGFIPYNAFPDLVQVACEGQVADLDVGHGTGTVHGGVWTR